MSTPPTLTSRILEGSAGRDRVLDFVKVAALALVVIGHQLAWTALPDGTAVNTLDAAPSLWWVTWVLQWLPVFFFAAGCGLVRSTTAGRSWREIVRASGVSLLSPAIPLLLLTVLLSWLVSLWRPTLAGGAGLVPVQLLWFVGVYLLVVVLGPVLVLLRSALWLVPLVAAVIVVDLLRIHVEATWGWLNLPLVWAIFAVIGVQRARWTSRWLLAAVGVACLAGAVLALTQGPYSLALISTGAVPGLSNLAPPTIVLCLVGIAQICLLLLMWPVLHRWLSRDRVWVVVAIAASRAMGIYIWHMIITGLVIAGVFAIGIAPVPLGTAWWLLHVVCGVCVIALTWIVAGPAQRGAAALGRWASRLPWRAPSWLVLVAATAAAVGVLGASELGLYPLFENRMLIGFIPYVPIVGLAVIFAAYAVIAGRGRSNPVPDNGP